ncbi:MAG: ABC transporter permease subunit [Clostridia bacterium]
MPKPSLVIKDFFVLFATKDFYLSVFYTFLRGILAFLVSFVLALTLSILGNFFKPLHAVLSPYIFIMRSVPTMSVILLIILWVNSFTSPILIAFLVIFPIQYSSFFGAINNIDKDLLQMAEVYKIDKKNIVRKIYLSMLLPQILVAVKATIGLTVKVVIAGEVLAHTSASIGAMMQQAKIFIDTANLLAWTVVAILLSYFLESIITLILKKLRKKYGYNN